MISVTVGAGDGLAKISYLPGVIPPSPDSKASQVALKPALATQGPDVQNPDSQDTEGHDPEVEDLQAEVSAVKDFEAELLDREEESAWEAEERRAANISMRALTRHGVSRWELGELLLSRDLDTCIVESELDRLERVGLIDDAALAETLVRTQHERKGTGRSVIAADLRRRHIDRELIDEALSRLDEGSEQLRATELAVKRAGQLRSYDRETATRRLTAFLMRKGYPSPVVRNAVGEAMSGRSSDSGSRGVSFR